MKKTNYTELINDILQDKTLSHEEKLRRINEISEKRGKEYDREFMWEKIKIIGGGVIIIGSSVIPVTHLLKGAVILSKVSPAAAKLVIPLLKVLVSNLKLSKPLIQQIIVNSVKRSAVEGMVSGFLYGIGDSMSRGLNFKEALEKITETTIYGLALSVILGGIGSSIAVRLGRGSEILETFAKRKDWGIAYRKAMRNPKLAIETLLKYQRGFVPRAIYKKGLGNIDFVWGKHDYSTGKGFGFNHINARRSSQKNLDMNKFWNDFLDTLSNGIIKEDLKRPDNINIENFVNKIALARKSQGKNRIFPITSHPQNKSAVKRLATWKPMSKPYVDSRFRFTTELNRNNNISNFQQAFNPQLTKAVGNRFNQAFTVSALNNINNQNNINSPLGSINLNPNINEYKPLNVQMDSSNLNTYNNYRTPNYPKANMTSNIPEPVDFSGLFDLAKIMIDIYKSKKEKSIPQPTIQPTPQPLPQQGYEYYPY